MYGDEYSLLQTTQLRLILLIMGRALIIQYFPVLGSVPIRCLDEHNNDALDKSNSLTLWFAGKIIGFLALSNISTCLSLPPMTIRPLFNFGHYFIRLLDFDTWLRFWRSRTSSASTSIFKRFNIMISASLISDTVMGSFFTCLSLKNDRTRRNQQIAFLAL